MATILDAHDLSTGGGTSDVVSSPDNVNVSWKLTGLTGNGSIKLDIQVQVGSEDYHTLRNANGIPQYVVLGKNTSGNISLTGINATNLKVVVTTVGDVVAGATTGSITAGTLSIYAI